MEVDGVSYTFFFGRILREIKVKFSFFSHKITSANKNIPEGFFQDVQETILYHDW